VVGERLRKNPRDRGLACPPCAEEHHDAGLVEQAHEHGY
jgi:hypothetical protein